jgi:hypothetical protein
MRVTLDESRFPQEIEFVSFDNQVAFAAGAAFITLVP